MSGTGEDKLDRGDPEHMPHWLDLPNNESEVMKGSMVTVPLKVSYRHTKSFLD